MDYKNYKTHLQEFWGKIRNGKKLNGPFKELRQVGWAR